MKRKLFLVLIALPFIGFTQTRQNFQSDHVLFFHQAFERGNLSHNLGKILTKSDYRNYDIHIDEDSYIQDIKWIENWKVSRRDSILSRLKQKGYELLSKKSIHQYGPPTVVDILRNCEAEELLYLTYVATNKVQCELKHCPNHEFITSCHEEEKLIRQGWTLSSLPKIEIKNKDSGYIDIELTLDPEGNVLDGKIISSSINLDVTQKYLEGFKKVKFHKIEGNVQSYSITFRHKKINIRFKNL